MDDEWGSLHPNPTDGDATTPKPPLTTSHFCVETFRQITNWNPQWSLIEIPKTPIQKCFLQKHAKVGCESALFLSSVHIVEKDPAILWGQRANKL